MQKIAPSRFARQQSDRLGEAAGAGSLGNLYRIQGNNEASLKWLQQSLFIAEKIKKPAYINAANHGLGNTYANLAQRDYRYADYARESGKPTDAEQLTQTARDHDQHAIDYFEASLRTAHQNHHLIEENHALLNLASAYQRSLSTSPQRILNRALVLQTRLPDSRDKVYSLIRLANLLQQTEFNQAPGNPNVQCFSNIPTETITLLNEAIAVSQRIQDTQAEAFALGRSGHLYECQRRFPQAIKLTELAQLSAQNQGSRYLWDWQIGRIRNAQGQTIEAIAAYENAVKVLKEIRGDLAIASRDYQFDFRDSVEPVYRELTELQLLSTTPVTTLNQVNATPKRALETIDDLRIAELQNYLGEDCSIPIQAQSVAQVSDQTAVISTIILKDRIAVILALPNAEPQVHWVPASNQTVLATVNDLRLKLEDRSDLTNTYKAPSQQLYNWLIHPFLSDLGQANIDTLVFIQDGIFRSIPMTALYDGTDFLVEQFGIVTTTSLTLIDPTQLDTRSLRILGFGLTQASSIDESIFLAPLSFVKTELDQITQTLKGSKVFLNEAFTTERLQTELTTGNFPIVHLATHGQFGLDSRDTFLVTGKQIPATDAPPANDQNVNEKLTMNQLYQILQTSSSNKPSELLTLTACETAVGNDRDALGIAGHFYSSRSQRVRVASLWQVDDQATAELITQFYQNLRQGMGRAKALQVAQQDWLATT